MTSVRAERAALGYGDTIPVFNNFESLYDNIAEWSPKVNVHDLYESDFYEWGTASGLHDAMAIVASKSEAVIYVEPCEMFVIQLTLDWDMRDNWAVYNNF